MDISVQNQSTEVVNYSKLVQKALTKISHELTNVQSYVKNGHILSKAELNDISKYIPLQLKNILLSNAESRIRTGADTKKE